MKFSVVIPTCRRPDLLARCLRALPTSEEVIVSDDSPDDATRELVTRDFPHVRWVRGPRRGPAANRNHGASAATGDWLAFVDDDCEPQAGWLAALTIASVDAEVLEGCTQAPGATDSPLEEHVENLHGGVLWSCNLAIRRELFEKLGGFDPAFTEAAGEDMEFAWRLQQASVRIRFVSDAVVHHPPRHIGLRGLWKRVFMIRWMALYRARTGQLRSLPGTAIQESVDLLRITSHLITRFDPQRWRRQIFQVLLRWLTFPVVLPYFLYWTARFRRV